MTKNSYYKNMLKFIQNLLSKKDPENKLTVGHKYLKKYKQLVQPAVFNALLQEYISGDVIFEPIRDKLSEAAQDELYSRIDKADFLSNQEKYETIIALMYLIDGSFTESEKIMSRFEKIFGKGFVEMIERKRGDFKNEIALKKAIRFIKNRKYR